MSAPASRVKLSKLSFEEKKQYFTAHRTILSTKSQLKDFQRRNGRSLGGGNPDSAWLAGLQPVPLERTDDRWTQAKAAGAVITTYEMLSYSDELRFNVGDINVIFNNFPDNPGWFGDSNISSQSMVQFTSSKLAHLQAGLNPTELGGEFSIPAIQQATGLFYGTEDTNSDRFFSQIKVVPLVLDSTGLATTWRLDIMRAFESGEALAVQFLVETKQFDTYSETNISCLQSQNELNYCDGDTSTLQFFVLLPSTWDSISTSTIGNFYGSGGIITVSDVNTTPYVSASINNTSTTVANSTITGQTVTWRIPNVLSSVFQTSVTTEPSSETTKNIVFGFDLTTLLFMVLILVLAVSIITVAIRYLNGGFQKSRPISGISPM